MKVNNSIFILMLGLVLASCRKESIVPQPPLTSTPENFDELQVPADFSWSTLRELTLKFEGYQAPVNINRKLEVRVPGGTRSIFSAQVSIHSILNFQIQLPAAVNEIEVVYGAVVKRFPVSSSIQFSPKPAFE